MAYLTENKLDAQAAAHKMYTEYLKTESELVKQQTPLIQQKEKKPTRVFITTRHLFTSNV